MHYGTSPYTFSYSSCFLVWSSFPFALHQFHFTCLTWYLTTSIITVYLIAYWLVQLGFAWSSHFLYKIHIYHIYAPIFHICYFQYFFLPPITCDEIFTMLHPAQSPLALCTDTTNPQRPEVTSLQSCNKQLHLRKHLICQVFRNKLSNLNQTLTYQVMISGIQIWGKPSQMMQLLELAHQCALCALKFSLLTSLQCHNF